MSERMPKSVAIFILSLFAIGALGIWSIFNGHEDAVMVGELVFVGVLGLIATVGVCWLIYEALRALIWR